MIRDDDCIYRLEANKKLVDRPEQAGISIIISEYLDCPRSSWINSGKSLTGGSLVLAVEGSNNVRERRESSPTSSG